MEQQKMEDHKMELEVLRKDMVAAMKAKDKVTKEAVSSLIAAEKKLPLMRDAVMISKEIW